MLIDAFLQNDKQKVQELHQYLSENFDQNSYVTLFPFEKTLLFAWTGDFKNMLQYVKEVDSTYIAQMQIKIMPSSANNFYQTAKQRVQQEFEDILGNIQTSSLTQEEKDFAAIYLRYYLITDENYDTIVRTINTNTRKFVETYPQSEYIQSLDSYELRPSKWGSGIGINIGYATKTGAYSKSFKNSASMDPYFEFAYNKIMTTMGVSVSFGEVREDIVISDDLVLP
ncbi:MAG: hypothetical protein FWD56_06605, partial [Bacteroidales bacterium]|nr:hypothetical protein [Bacteroidales bacterium]